MKMKYPKIILILIAVIILIIVGLIVYANISPKIRFENCKEKNKHILSLCEAFNDKTIQACDNISEKSFLKDYCRYLKITVKAHTDKNSNDCELINDTFLKGVCFMNIKDNEEGCKTITSSQEKGITFEECISLILDNSTEFDPSKPYFYYFVKAITTLDETYCGYMLPNEDDAYIDSATCKQLLNKDFTYNCEEKLNSFCSYP